MPQEPKPEPTQTFTAKAGLPGSPQPLEVKPPATDLKPWDLDSLPHFEHMGRPRPRVEAPLKVTGRAKYVEDYKADGMLHARLLTSPLPHARARNIDVSRALARLRENLRELRPRGRHQQDGPGRPRGGQLRRAGAPGTR